MKKINVLGLIFILTIFLSFYFYFKGEKRVQHEKVSIDKKIDKEGEKELTYVKTETIQKREVDYIPLRNEEKKIPEWFNNFLTIFNENYQSWIQKKDISSLIAKKGTTEEKIEGDKVSMGTNPIISNPYSTNLYSNINPLSTLNRPDTLKSSEKLSLGDLYSFSQKGITSQEIKNEENEKKENDEEKPKEENQNKEIIVKRKIDSSIDRVNITLSININTSITGLIITENIPEGYTIIASSPMYSKKTENTYKWLFYGKSVENQNIYYQLKGNGGGVITGTFSSSLGSGNIEGDNKI